LFVFQTIALSVDIVHNDGDDQSVWAAEDGCRWQIVEVNALCLDCCNGYRIPLHTLSQKTAHKTKLSLFREWFVEFVQCFGCSLYESKHNMCVRESLTTGRIICHPAIKNDSGAIL